MTATFGLGGGWEDRHRQELGRKVWKDSGMLRMHKNFTELAVLVLLF